MVCIKNMEMPADCSECVLCNSVMGCPLCFSHEECPLVPDIVVVDGVLYDASRAKIKTFSPMGDEYVLSGFYVK